jgi:hypothetical protein
MTSLARASQLVALGLSVIPIPAPRPGVPENEPGGGKVPARSWAKFQNELPTDAELVEGFDHEPLNIGIVTGAVSGVVVVDADDPIALRWCTKHLPYTPWQTQTSRGFHLFYRHPGVRVPNRARLDTPNGKLAIDVRGDGGFVIVAPSVHASGPVYREAGDWSVPRTEVPRFWPGWLERPKCKQATTSHLPKPTGNLVDRARKYLAAIPVPVIGAGSDNGTLYAACRLTRGFGLSTAEAEALLWEWAGGRPGWTREWITAKVRHAERYGTEPVGALR